jgi:TPR repeat protein
MRVLLLCFYFATTAANAADFQIASACWDRKDYQCAFNELLPLARHGDSEAQKLLGQMYADGLGIKKDLFKAESWLNRAASQGDAEAKKLLDKVYIQRTEEDKNKPIELINIKGFSCFYDKDYECFIPIALEEAEKGNSDYQHLLGKAYTEGLGVAKDPKKSRKWLSKAAKQDDISALFYIAKINSLGIGGEVNYPLAARALLRGANLGDAASQAALAQSYALGRGLRQDYGQAKYWAGLSCDNGNQTGCDFYRKLNKE